MEPLSSLELRSLDPGLVEAVDEANQQHSMLPIIKNELKNKILLHRLTNGKGDIDIYEKKPKIKRELTDEEVQKKLRRKEQNRRAATRCRKKKKVLESKVQTDYFREQQHTAALQMEVDDLQQQRAQLLQILQEHSLTCMRGRTTNELAPGFVDPSASPFTPPFTDQPVDQFHRETNTPCDDPFDDPFVGTTCEMYSSAPPNFHSKPQPEVHIPEPPCTSTSEYPDEDLPAEFREFSSGFFQPCSPDLILGRQSISEYLDDPEPQCQNFIGL